jgi:hypothetical protein
MDERNDTGVKGFFAEYGKGGGPRQAAPIEVEKPKVPPEKEVRRKVKQLGKRTEKARARTGRPPGIANGSRSQKEKATMHINAALMDFYRDWSWEARCNLGELIERAMVAYKSRRNRAGDKKS